MAEQLLHDSTLYASDVVRYNTEVRNTEAGLAVVVRDMWCSRIWSGG